MTRRRYLPIPIVAVAAAVALASPPARAAIPGESRSDVHYEYRKEICDFGTVWDTGWVPSGGDIQIRVTLRIDCEFAAMLDGEGVMVWPPSMQLYFLGDRRGGRFTESIGIFFEARIRWDLDVGGSGEAPIPFVPRVDLGCLDRRVDFTPFLLSGNPSRPARIACALPRVTLFEDNVLRWVGIPDLVRGIVKIDMGVNVNSYFQGNRIEVDEHDQRITEEYGRAYVYPRTSPAMEMTARYVADLSHQIIVTFYPEIRFEVGFCPLCFTYTIDIVDIPVRIPESTDQWVFNPSTMAFEFPDIDVQDLLDFGRTMVDRPRLLRLEVQNVGLQRLFARPRTALPFGVDETVTLDIDAPGRDDMVVSFDPGGGVGRAAGVLRLQTNDPDEPWVDVRLIGEATTEYVPEPDAGCEGDACPDEGHGYFDAGPGCGCAVPGGRPVAGLAALAVFLCAIAFRRRR